MTANALYRDRSERRIIHKLLVDREPCERTSLGETSLDLPGTLLATLSGVI